MLVTNAQATEPKRKRTRILCKYIHASNKNYPPNSAQLLLRRRVRPVLWPRAPMCAFGASIVNRELTGGHQHVLKIERFGACIVNRGQKHQTKSRGCSPPRPRHGRRSKAITENTQHTSQRPRERSICCTAPSPSLRLVSKQQMDRSRERPCSLPSI